MRGETAICDEGRATTSQRRRWASYGDDDDGRVTATKKQVLGFCHFGLVLPFWYRGSVLGGFFLFFFYKNSILLLVCFDFAL